VVCPIPEWDGSHCRGGSPDRIVPGAEAHAVGAFQDPLHRLGSRVKSPLRSDSLVHLRIANTDSVSPLCSPFLFTDFRAGLMAG
jgi:hypothetical protein